MREDMSGPSAMTTAATTTVATAAAEIILSPSIPSEEGGAPAHKAHDQGNRVLYRDVEDFQRKRQRIVDEGAEHLQIISDFDFTMTKFWVNGRMGHSCHQVIGDCGLLSKEYHTRTAELKNHYYPMEVDPLLSHEKRVEMMVEWVTKAHEVMVAAGMTKDTIAKAVSTSNLELRSGHGELFRWVEREGVPLLLFSAGIADVLEEVLRQRSEAPVPSTTHVISNRMEFDEEGTMKGFSGQCFHVFNKHASSAVDETYFRSDEVRRRGNVVLLGDSLGDLNMAQGIGSREVLSIGFLNDKVEERMDAYMKAYDAVIVGDGGLGFVLDILADVSTKACP